MKKEIELKYLLSSKADFQIFERFLEQYRTGPKRVLRQVNSYFDTPSLSFRRAGISLRLRRENGEYFLSAKQSMGKKSSTQRHLSVRLEYEGNISARIASLVSREQVSALDAFSFLRSQTEEEELTRNTLYQHMKKAAQIGLQIIGSFSNTRTKMPIVLDDQAVTLELDHSIYPKGIEIFEVEVEFEGVRQANSLRPRIEGLFRKAGLRTYRSSSKSSRLYRILFG